MSSPGQMLGFHLQLLEKPGQAIVEQVTGMEDGVLKDTLVIDTICRIIYKNKNPKQTQEKTSAKGGWK